MYFRCYVTTGNDRDKREMSGNLTARSGVIHNSVRINEL
jgi:hypothetical protein